MSQKASPEKSPVVSMIETHEEFIQHIEGGSSMMRTLSAITIVVSFVLLLAYISQLLLPYATGVTSQTVSLVDPTLQVTEVAVSVLALLWLYVGIRDLLFSRRMRRAIKEIRALESDIEKQMAG
ncbi:MAG TPA: hypothetical protein VKF15_02985 [Nitrososphaerales archaeon]|nr:hypothetical protein [Nitrososphaerales archaeon]